MRGIWNIEMTYKVYMMYTRYAALLKHLAEIRSTSNDIINSKSQYVSCLLMLYICYYGMIYMVYHIPHPVELETRGEAS